MDAEVFGAAVRINRSVSRQGKTEIKIVFAE
jgi:hypothetical protein